jgi:hypothetical protein
MRKYGGTHQEVKTPDTIARDGRREATIEKRARISINTGAKKQDP